MFKDKTPFVVVSWSIMLLPLKMKRNTTLTNRHLLMNSRWLLRHGIIIVELQLTTAVVSPRVPAPAKAKDLAPPAKEAAAPAKEKDLAPPAKAKEAAVAVNAVSPRVPPAPGKEKALAPLAKEKAPAPPAKVKEAAAPAKAKDPAPPAKAKDLAPPAKARDLAPPAKARGPAPPAKAKEAAAAKRLTFSTKVES